MVTDSIGNIGSTSKIISGKKEASKATQKAKAKDKLSFSEVAQKAVDKKKFVDMLSKMPEVKKTVKEEKDYDFSSAKVLQGLKQRLIDEGIV